MEKTYIVLIAANGKYSLESYSDYTVAVAYISDLVQSQEILEGKLDIEHFGAYCGDQFGKQRTTFYPFFGKVIYGIETTNSRNEKMSRMIFEVDAK